MHLVNKPLVCIIALLIATLLYQMYEVKLLRRELSNRSTAEHADTPRTLASSQKTKSPSNMSSPVDAISPLASEGNVASTQDRLNARLSAMKEVFWRYARFFAKGNLSQQKADLLLELLVDQQMAALETSLQLGVLDGSKNVGLSQIDQAVRLNRKLIEDLLGPAAAQDLYSSSLEQTFANPSQKPIEVISAQGPLATNSKASVEHIFGNYVPMQGIDKVINSGQELTTATERSFREIQSARIEAAILQLQGVISLEQANALREWNRAETDKALEFAKVFWIQNHRKG